MTHEQDHKSIEDLVVSNSIQFDTLYRLLIEKGLITETEFDHKLNEVQADYQTYNSKANESETPIHVWLHLLITALIPTILLIGGSILRLYIGQLHLAILVPLLLTALLM
mgnify:CR=1 FL=1